MSIPGIVQGGILYPTGWINNPFEVQRILGLLPHPIFAAAAAPIKDSGKGKVVLLYQANRKVFGKDFCHKQTIGDCFPRGTMVLGERTKPIEQVRIGDRVWTAQGKLTRVVSTRAIETHRPLVRIHSVGGLPIACTADHQFLVYRMDRVAGKRVTSAYYERALSAEPQGFSKSAVTAIYEARHPEWVAAQDLVDTDCLLTPTHFAAIPLPESIPGDLGATPAGRRVLGYFLGNGHASGGSLEFAVSKPAVDAELVATLTAAGFRPKVSSYRDECGAWRIRVHDRVAVHWFREQFYDEDGVKSFPGWALGDAEFLRGLAQADGHEPSGCHAIDSTSDSIVSATIASLIQLGHEPTVNRVTRSGGEYANAKPLWRVIWRDDKQKTYVWRDQDFVCRPVRRIEFLEGPTTVYDIGVADPHHSFLANTHGVHNCVSHGWSLFVDTLKCCQIFAGQHEKFTGETATEVMYAGARITIGHGQCGSGDGAVGAWASQYVTQFGTLIRAKYGDIDLTDYDGNRAKSWGAPGRGVPSQLDAMIKEHPVKTVSMVKTYEEARDAIANLYPVAVCSGQGFAMTRDQDGFARPSGSWGHCMCFIGVDDSYNRPGLLCMNSWGPDWISGPKRNDQPEGSFWVDPETVNRMFQEEDSFTGSGYVGYPSQDVDYDFLATS